MKYNEILAIDKIEYRERVERNEESPTYVLKNFNYYSKLEREFYKYYFISEFLFEIDVSEVDEFLDVQFENSKNIEALLKCIKLKISPLIKNIIDNPGTGFSSNTESNAIKLENDFYRIDNIVKNSKYNLSHLQHRTRFSISEDLKIRGELLDNYIDRIATLKNNQNKNSLKWIGKPSHLALIIRSLVDKGFIKAPLGNDDEINLTELSKQILSSFEVEKGAAINTLRTYCSVDNDKAVGLVEKFDSQGFNIPLSSFVG